MWRRREVEERRGVEHRREVEERRGVEHRREEERTKAREVEQKRRGVDYEGGREVSRELGKKGVAESWGLRKVWVANCLGTQMSGWPNVWVAKHLGGLLSGCRMSSCRMSSCRMSSCQLSVNPTSPMPVFQSVVTPGIPSFSRQYSKILAVTTETCSDHWTF